MSQLSNRDFYNEFGENLLIFPFNRENIKGSSINLSVSDYAWDLNTKKMLSSFMYNNKKILIVSPFSTAAVMTQEVIYVGKNICGTYHSKVGMTTRGFSNISTTLDPEYIGTSLICIHNNTAVQQELIVGEVFATLMLAYVTNPAFDEMIDKPNTPGQRERVSAYENGHLFVEKQRQEGYHDNYKNLKKVMNENEAFKLWKKEFLQKDTLLMKIHDNAAKKKKKKIIAVKVALHLLSWGIIILVAYNIIKVIETITSLSYLKSYVSIIVLVMGFGINECLNKVILFCEKHIEKWWC